MVILSAGHFPKKPGHYFGNTSEHDEAMLWCLMVKEDLRAFDVPTVVLTPGPIREKIAQIRDLMPVLAIEIHFDADTSGLGKGSRTLYQPYDNQLSQQAAHLVHDGLYPIFGKDNGLHPGWYGANGKQCVDYFLSLTGTTSIIVIPEFMHNMDAINQYRVAACRMIAEGVIHFVSSN